MVKVLRTWGYEASREACQEWLHKYLKGNDGAKDGGAGVYVLSRQDLQRWYHVEGLTGAALQERYREECGIYADRAQLTRWISAQTLPSRENNEDIHTHACGEYVLEQLQSGKTPEEVVEQLLAEYLVKTTKERVQAYRYYREQRGSYWTTEKLQQHHWERLYAQVSLEHALVPKTSGSKKTERRMITVREALCQELRIAEESVPLHALRVFYRNNEFQAQLALRYPTASVIKDALPCSVILAYQNAMAGQVLPGTGFKCINASGEGRYAATLAAADPGYIVWPRACADACFIAAYSMLKCESLINSSAGTPAY